MVERLEKFDLLSDGVTPQQAEDCFRKMFPGRPLASYQQAVEDWKRFTEAGKSYQNKKLRHGSAFCTCKECEVEPWIER